MLLRLRKMAGGEENAFLLFSSLRHLFFGEGQTGVFYGSLVCLTERLYFRST